MYFPKLETTNLNIEPIQESDFDVVFDFNSCEESLKYIIRNPLSEEEARQKLNYFVSSSKDGSANWWVFRIKETGEKIGYGGLFDISKEHHRAEIGYGLVKKYWNKGYMTEALNAIIQYGIKDLKLHKIYGVVISGNIASSTLLERKGFKKEAHLIAHSIKDGKYVDEIIYGLISNH